LFVYRHCQATKMFVSEFYRSDAQQAGVPFVVYLCSVK